MSFGKSTAMVGCIRQVILFAGVSYHTRIDYSGGDNGDEFIIPARASLVPLR
jgi:hypothetical protein